MLVLQVHYNYCDVIVDFPRFALGNFLQLLQSHACTCGSFFEGLADQAYRNQFSLFSLRNLCHLLSLKFVPKPISGHDNPPVVPCELKYLDFRLPSNVLASKKLERVLVVLLRGIILRIVEFRMF